MSEKQSLIKLVKIIEEISTIDTFMFYRNSFALICYLASIGEMKAAEKQLSNYFNVLGRESRKTYFSAIYSSLEEFAADYANEIMAHVEINHLFKKNA